MTDAPRPKAPTRLSAVGRRLWREVVADYTLRPDELVLLEKACRTADDSARLDTALLDAPMLVSGSMGQQRAHPLLHESRQTRSLLAALLKQLGLPDPADESANETKAQERSAHAMTAARARWGGGGRRGA